MTKYELINSINLIKSKENDEQHYFNNKLIELKKMQNETLERMNLFRKNMFPDIMYKYIASNFPNNASNSSFVVDHKCIKMFDCLGNLNFYFVEEKKQIKISTSNNMNEIFDWWSAPTYRQSHLIKRFNELRFINDSLDFIEKNILEFYQEISNRINAQRIKEYKITLENIAELEKDNIKKSDNTTVKIIIQVLQ